MNMEHLNALSSARTKYNIALNSVERLGLAKAQSIYFNLLSSYGGELIDEVNTLTAKLSEYEAQIAELKEECDVLGITIDQQDKELDELRSSKPRKKGD